MTPTSPESQEWAPNRSQRIQAMTSAPKIKYFSIVVASRPKLGLRIPAISAVANQYAPAF